jgi:predicted AAA+ superfamily ATPase
MVRILFMVDVIGFLKNAMLSGEGRAVYYAKPEKRDLYMELLKKPRMHIIYGMRGGGKTTLLFQRFMDYPKGKRVYLSGDEVKLYGFSLLSIFDALKYVSEMDRGAVFLDEITKIRGWGEELKIIYDAYPNLDVYVSGSSAVELTESKRTLARRAKYHHLLPMTFREYMRVVHGLRLERFNLFARDVYTAGIRYDIYFKEEVKRNPLRLVEEYSEKNQPFLLEADESMLMDLMDKIIYEDISKVYPFSSDVLDKFHRLILILAMSEKTSYENLSRDLGLSKGVVGQMIRALANSGVIKAVLPFGAGRVVGRKTWRYFFLVPAIRKMYMKKGGADDSRIIGFVREDIVVSHLDDVFYVPNGPDFVYKNVVLEVGGHGKDTGQFARVGAKKQKIIVYDGVEVVKAGDVVKLPFYIFLSHV